jgi:hypothetical protein
MPARDASYHNAMASAFGVDLVFGATTIAVILSDATDEILRGFGSTQGGRDVNAVGTRVACEAAGLVVGSSVTVDGESFRIRAIERIEDGSFLRLRLGSS